ncbi:MAG: NAD(P)-dependent glycerol-3-phosphate dehydrogenase [Chloroflexi bacterium]|nr:NAD(P)-dependent glycerol-3-phosphate dehydrogenase [Chloroflexota bacterium]
MEQRAAVIGTTRWGTTLALLLARRGVPVTLWARTEAEAASLQAARENRELLPGHPFPPALQVTADLAQGLHDADIVVIAVPSARVRQNARLLRGLVPRDAILLGATKGLERGTGRRMSQVLADELGEEALARYAVLSGPNLSGEIVRGLPASTVVASLDAMVAQRAQALFTSPLFRVYTNSDLIGVELGGALKNIVALGAGMADGMGYGDNGKAAFIARGIAEITRLGVAAGSQPLTFAGLACLGDLIATCYSPLSRNHYVGLELAKGRHLQEILAGLGQVVEGVDTTPAALLLAGGLGIEMPIAYQTYRVLYEGLDPRQALEELMARAPKPEDPFWSGPASLA